MSNKTPQLVDLDDVIDYLEAYENTHTFRSDEFVALEEMEAAINSAKISAFVGKVRKDLESHFKDKV